METGPTAHPLLGLQTTLLRCLHQVSKATGLHESLCLFTRIVLNFSPFAALRLMVVLCPDVNSFTFQMLFPFFG